jgi:hypothetical protein
MNEKEGSDLAGGSSKSTGDGVWYHALETNVYFPPFFLDNTFRAPTGLAFTRAIDSRTNGEIGYSARKPKSTSCCARL